MLYWYLSPFFGRPYASDPDIVRQFRPYRWTWRRCNEMVGHNWHSTMPSSLSVVRTCGHVWGSKRECHYRGLPSSGHEWSSHAGVVGRRIFDTWETTRALLEIKTMGSKKPSTTLFWRVEQGPSYTLMLGTKKSLKKSSKSTLSPSLNRLSD